jgi:hypothetical protein
MLWSQFSAIVAHLLRNVSAKILLKGRNSHHTKIGKCLTWRYRGAYRRRTATPGRGCRRGRSRWRPRCPSRRRRRRTRRARRLRRCGPPSSGCSSGWPSGVDWISISFGRDLMRKLFNHVPILRLLNLQLQRQRCSRLERFFKVKKLFLFS